MATSEAVIAETELQPVADVFQAVRDELGTFVSTGMLDTDEWAIIERDGTPAAAARYRHCSRKPQTTLYDIAVLPEYRGQHLGLELVHRLGDESPHEKLVAKCPVTNAATAWYRNTGWSLRTWESTTDGAVAVWGRPTETVDLFTTGRADLIQTARRFGWRTGARTDKVSVCEHHDIPVEFIDLNWHEPDVEALFDQARRHHPAVVVAGDYRHEQDGEVVGESIDVVNDRAAELAAFTERVVVVPHAAGEVEHVPDWATVGYSTPTRHGATTAPITEYRGRDVHVLGGRFRALLETLAELGRDVVSVDTNAHQFDAVNYGKGWSRTGGWEMIGGEEATENAKAAYRTSAREFAEELAVRGLFNPYKVTE